MEAYVTFNFKQCTRREPLYDINPLTGGCEKCAEHATPLLLFASSFRYTHFISDPVARSASREPTARHRFLPG